LLNTNTKVNYIQMVYNTTLLTSIIERIQIIEYINIKNIKSVFVLSFDCDW